MRQIEITDLRDNVFKTISTEWMLITAGTKTGFNTMTANWGGFGFLWKKPVAFIFVRPERYTYEFVERNDYFTLSFLGEENKNVHKVCGFKSGRTTDKIKETGLRAVETDNGNILFEQSRLSIECRKLYSDMIASDNFIDKSILEHWYGETHGGLHRMYIGEILHVWAK